MTLKKNSPVTENLEFRFRKALTALVPRGARIVVAVSGGPDSMALLHLLLAVRDDWSLELLTAHLDHGLRGAEGARDLDVVKATAAALGVPFVSDRIDCRNLRRVRSTSIEEAAREARYGFLEKVRREAGYDWIATGHTADDQAESILINLLRGAGPTGLSGMPPVRGRVIRPFLDIRRRDILTYLQEKQQSFVQDSTNQDLTLTRNRVRLDLLPKLEQDYNPNLKAGLIRMAGIFRDEEAFWERTVEAAKDHAAFRGGPDGVRLKGSVLAGLDRALARRLVRAAVESLAGSVKSLGFDHVEAVLAMAADGDIKAIDLPRAIRVRREADDLVLDHVGEGRTYTYEYPLSVPGFAEIPEIGCLIRAQVVDRVPIGDMKQMGPDQVLLDQARVVLPLTVRSPRPGDRFRPLGLAGRKKLSDFFIDAKVPVAQRPAVPLVVDGQGEIIWVAGHRPADSVKVREDTRRVIRLQLDQDS